MSKRRQKARPSATPQREYKNTLHTLPVELVKLQRHFIACDDKILTIAVAAGSSETDVLRLAATVEQGSDHPLAEAIKRRAEGVPLEALVGFVNIEGKGARADVAGRAVLIGNRRLMEEQRVDMQGLVGEQMAEMFAADRALCVPFSLREWQARSPVRRWLTRLAAVAAPLM